MLTLITGAPGSGKTNALVSLLQEVSEGRALYTHGIPELLIPHQELKDPLNWMTEVPDGSLIVIDEVQTIWRPRGPGKTPPDSVTALETHRHRGLDFYLITQGPNLVDSNVRALVGRHIHLREMGILGRWWYEWPECADNCRTAWKNAPIKKRYRLDKKVQSLYKSASMHVKPVRSVPWMLSVLAIALVVAGSASWFAYKSISSKMRSVEPVSSAKVALPGSSPLERGPPSHASASGSGSAYDAMSFIPRVNSVPNSAPAFDHLRAVVAMPIMTSGIAVDGKATCFTQQGTIMDISNEDCLYFMARKQFDPYKPDQAPAQASSSTSTPNPSPDSSTKPARSSPA